MAYALHLTRKSGVTSLGYTYGAKALRYPIHSLGLNLTFIDHKPLRDIVFMMEGRGVYREYLCSPTKQSGTPHA